MASARRRSMKLHLLICVLLTIGLVTKSASACVVRYRDPGELKSEAGIVVQALVLSKEISEQSQLGEFYSYTVQVKVVERGTMELAAPRRLTYYNGRAREQNGTIVCPRKDGSGYETQLQIGSRYRFFIKSNKKTEILFSEKPS
jgi:hypothetical protein